MLEALNYVAMLLFCFRHPVGFFSQEDIRRSQWEKNGVFFHSTHFDMPYHENHTWYFTDCIKLSLFNFDMEFHDSGILLN